MKLLLSLSFCIALLSSVAQNNIQYDDLDFGDYSIGFTDSIIYRSNIPYHYKSYSGATPILLKIWHPVKAQQSKPLLSVNAFRETNNLPIYLKEVESDLLLKFDDYYRKTILDQDYIHFDEIKYPVLGSELLLDYIKKTKSKSHRSKLKREQNFPIIIYHHGSRGTAFDNHVMAEYLASHGYIVIAGNFNLPYENHAHGFTKNDPYDTRLGESIIEFAQKLGSEAMIGFIGHSWGAQIGFSLMPKETRVSAFVSMETTLELWTRKQVKVKWPNLSGNIMKNYSNYSLPILMFANKGEEMEISFDFFKPIQSPQMIFASCRKEFVHESYASYYSSRLIYKDSFEQHDAVEFKKQVDYYGVNLKLIRSFLDQNLKGKSADYSDFEDLFYIKIKNTDSEEEEPMPALLNSPN